MYTAPVGDILAVQQKLNLIKINVNAQYTRFMKMF